MKQTEDTDVLNCQTCGACCHGDDGWVHVGVEDDTRMNSLLFAHSLVVTTRHGGFEKRSLKMIHQKCAALTQTSTHVHCEIYSVRPTVCRELAVGSIDCLRARHSRGL